jgi:hypothetical protein
VVSIDAVVMYDLAGALTDSGKIRTSLRLLRTILKVLILQDSGNKTNYLGPGGETLDPPREKDVACGDGRDSGLICTAKGQVNLPGSTDVGDKVSRWGVGGNRPGRVTKREGCAHPPRIQMREGPKVLGTAMDSEEKVPTVGDGVMILEDDELRVFEKHKVMGFGWVANDVPSVDSPQGAADNRVGVDFAGAEDND